MTPLALEAPVPSDVPEAGHPARNRQMLVLAAIGVLVAAVGVSTSLAGSLFAPVDWRIPGLAGGIYPWLLAASALVFLAAQAVLLAPLVCPVGPTQAGPSRSGRAMEATWTALPVVFTLALSIYSLAASRDI